MSYVWVEYSDGSAEYFEDVKVLCDESFTTFNYEGGYHMSPTAYILRMQVSDAPLDLIDVECEFDLELEEEDDEAE